MRRKWKMLFIAPAAIMGIALFIIFGGWVVMRLWNWLLPGLFGWHQIAFWQALGLMILCRILFGGHGWRGPGRSNFRRRMSERWEQMTPEDARNSGGAGRHGAGSARRSKRTRSETMEPIAEASARLPGQDDRRRLLAVLSDGGIRRRSFVGRRPACCLLTPSTSSRTRSTSL